MSNQYPVILHMDQGKAANWDLKTLFQRWGQLFSFTDSGETIPERLNKKWGS
ncbi:MAG: hypothetical protein V3V12_05480 [Gammaproteobacteria bacterium]